MRQFAKLAGLLLLVAAGGFLGAGLVVLLNDGTYLRATDKFDIFINVLFVTFGILTVGGFVTYTFVRDALAKDLEKKLNVRLRQIDREVVRLERERKSKLGLSTAAVFGIMAVAHWRESEGLWRANEFRKLEDDVGWKRKIVVGWKLNIHERERILLYLDLAIGEGKEGLRSLGRVKPDEADQEYMRRLTLDLKNTLAYLLATRRRPEDIADALKLQEDVGEAAGSDYDYLETTGWVLMRFGELYPGDDRTERGRQIIRDILNRDEIEASWRKNMLEKYKACFPKAFNSL